MSDSNRVRLALVAETSYGVQKTGSPLQILRLTGESLKQGQQVTTSNEIRSDRQISNIKRNNVNADGDISIEMSYNSYDSLILAALMHNPTAVTVTATDLSAAAADNSFNDASSGLGSIVAGQWIQVTGFTGNPANNGWFYVKSATAAKLIVTGGTLVDDSAGESVVIVQGGWLPKVDVAAATTIAAVASGNHFTDSGNGFGSLAVGSWIEVRGFATAANNGFFKIASKVSAGDITVSGGTLVNESATPSVTISQGAAAFNGITKTSFNIERTYEDLASEMALFLGMMVEQLALSISVDQIITGAFSFMGKTESSVTSTGGTGYTDPTTTEPVNAVDDVTAILENQTAFTASQLSLQIKNNLRGKQKIGTLGSFEVGVGSCNITGNLTAYYESKTVFDKYLNQTKTSLVLIIEDAAGNTYVIDMPSVKFSSGERGASGINSDVMVPLAFTAYMDATELKTIKIVKFAA